MSADIVECIDVVLPVAADDDVEAADVVLQPVTRFLETDFVCDELPFPGEDGSLLQLVHFR